MYQNVKHINLFFVPFFLPSPSWLLKVSSDIIKHKHEHKGNKNTRSSFAVLLANRPFSYSRYCNETSLQARLMRGNIIIIFAYEEIVPHEPGLHARSSSAPRIRISSIDTNNEILFYICLHL